MRFTPSSFCEDLLDLGAGHDDGQPVGALGADELLELRERLLEDVAVEEEEGAESLVLGGSADSFLYGEA